MKLLYFNYLYDSNQDSVGASVHVRQIVEAMQNCGYEIRAYSLNVSPKQSNGHLPLRRKLRQRLKKRLKRYVGQFNQLFKNVKLFFQEWKIISKERPDVLMIRYNLLNFSASIVAKLKRIPVVLEVNSPHAFERKNLTNDVWHLPLIPFIIERLNFCLADRIITVSEALKKYYLERKVPDDKIFVIPNGVNIKRFNPDISSLLIREKFALGNQVVMGFVGSFHYWHGLDNIMHLIDRIYEKYQNVSYLLVGDGPLKRKVEDFVTSSNYDDRVILTGYVPHEDVPSHVAAMDIVLAPYPHMNFFYFSPLKLFEYMAAGKAVVASEIGQIAEIIKNGENGFLYDPGDLDSFVEKTCELIEDTNLRKRFGVKSRATIVNSFTWEKNVKSIMNVMLSLNHNQTGRLSTVTN